MQFQVINGGDATAAALLYKPPPPALSEYLYNNMQNVINTASNLSTSFIDNVKSMYNSVHSEAAKNFNSFIKYAVGEHLGDNTIIYIDRPNIPNANPIMQQYIMAEPQLYDLYRRDLVYGYGETYRSLETGVENKDTVVYSNVMDGVVQYDDDGNGYRIHYTDSNYEITPEISRYDRLSILETWDNVKSLLADGIDPTTGEER